MLPAIRGRLVALIVVLAASYAVAQQSPAPEAPPPKSTETPSTEDVSKGEGEKATEAQGEANAAPPKPASAKGSPQRFEPTEKVRPDFDVAFPVDI